VVNATQPGIEPLLAIKRESHHEPLMERFAPDANTPQTRNPLTNMVHRLSTHADSRIITMKS
jgi:hypothetical protein